MKHLKFYKDKNIGTILILVVLFSSNYCFANDGITFLKRGEKAYKNTEYTKAVHFFKKSCNMGIIQGCYNMGYLYYIIETKKMKNIQNNIKAHLEKLLILRSSHTFDSPLIKQKTRNSSPYCKRIDL